MKLITFDSNSIAIKDRPVNLYADNGHVHTIRAYANGAIFFSKGLIALMGLLPGAHVGFYVDSFGQIVISEEDDYVNSLKVKTYDQYEGYPIYFSNSKEVTGFLLESSGMTGKVTFKPKYPNRGYAIDSKGMRHVVLTKASNDGVARTIKEWKK